MPRLPVPKNKWQCLVLILSVIALIVVRMNKALPGRPDVHPRNPSSREPATGDSRNGAAGTWTTLGGCRLVEHRDNDGDSFVLEHGGEQITYRLYFADCPEKRRHQYNGERIAEQGRYFGGLSEAGTIAIGEEARDFALGLLREGPVAVLTRGEKVYDSDRRYAFVTAGGQDLAEALIGRGLARIHTKGVSRPGGLSGSDEYNRLLQLERQAKSRHAGGWKK